jgi:hypothetical protein
MPTGDSYRKHSVWHVVVLLALGVSALTGCAGEDGVDGEDGTSCTVTENADGSATIECDDGTSADVLPGDDGGDGDDGVDGDDGTDGEDGEDGLDSGDTPGIDVDITISTPANGTHFVAGEEIIVTAEVTDMWGNPLFEDDLSTARIYMVGPRDVNKMVAAVDLLDAPIDREAADHQHHYVNMLTTANDNLDVIGNVWTYTLEPIVSEEAGTYTVGLWMGVAGYSSDVVIELADLQIGTATVEPLIITDGCDGCHLGDSNGQYYFHHVDPGYSPTGFPAIDTNPVQACWICHNTDGYAAVEVCDDGSVPGAGSTDDKCLDESTDWDYVSDAIVMRVHGIHVGENTPEDRSETNVNEDWGLFKHYIEVEFPSDVRNCTTCHATDAWKDNPSRLACGSCHDYIDFANGVGHVTQANDSGCAGCHTTGDNAITTVHAVDAPEPGYQVAFALDPAPGNASYYVIGDGPLDLDITLTESDGTTPVNWSTVTEAAWDRARLYVYGPYSNSAPALTDRATDPIDESDQRIDLREPAGGYTDGRISVTDNVLTYALDSVDGLAPGTYAAVLRFREDNEDYTRGFIEFQVGTVTPDPATASNCTDCHGDTLMHGWMPFETKYCYACHDYKVDRPLDAVVCAPGESEDCGWDERAWGFGRAPLSRYVHQFHMGAYLTDTTVPHYNSYEPVIFPQDLRNCTKCHEETDEWNEEPNRIACLACHDGADTAVHATLNTWDPTPDYPYDGDEAESCVVCHAGNSQFSSWNVHNIWDPYQPPYPREPAH